MTFNRTAAERETAAYMNGLLEEAKLLAELDNAYIEAEAEEDNRDNERRDLQSELDDAQTKIAELECRIDDLEALIRELRDNQ